MYVVMDSQPSKHVFALLLACTCADAAKHLENLAQAIARQPNMLSAREGQSVGT